MNRIRPQRLIGLSFGGWLAAGFFGAAFGQSPLAESTPTHNSKVHGTISVDFETVTIAELLKLVSAVEKVDGVVHIISSKPGDDAFIVSGSQGVVTLARPDSPDAPSMVIGRASSSIPPVRGQASPEFGESRSAPEFPRLAALGRWFGRKRPLETHPAVGPLPRSTPTSVMTNPTSEPDDSLATSDHGMKESIVDLDVGGSLGSLAAGEIKVVDPVHSPWPASSSTAEPASNTLDPDVLRTGGDTQRQSPAATAHRIDVQNESFEDLARRFYGDSRYAEALWWANRDRIAWPEALTPGKSIHIPALGELEPRRILTTSKRNPSESLAASRPGGPRRDPDVTRAQYVEPGGQSSSEAEPGGFAIHVVRPEDTLRIIAREKCGDERKALEIIALNRDVLTPEGRPRVGQRLILPTSGPTAATAP